MRARERIASLSSTFEERDTRLRTTDPLAFEGYLEQIARAKDESGLDEACIWGWAEIGGVRCALVVFDFAFMGGSMGMVVGEKVARAFDAARRSRAPVVTVTASGGARMQEGMWSLVQMAKTVEAQRRHAARGLAHITLLTSPTTGGVYASFASLGDVVLAEAGATIGFAGPRVVAELTGEAPASDLHTAEHAYAHGLVDAIVDERDAAAVVGLALHALTTSAPKPQQRDPSPADAPTSGLDAWERVQLVRADDRPKGSEILDALVSDAIELRGDRTGAADDVHVVVRAGRLASGRNVIAVAQHATDDGRIRPQGFRKATRAFDLGGRLGLPVMTVIDTRGADPLPASEEGGVAAAVARTFEAMLACRSPTLALLAGEGGSGGALAMAVADRVIAFENAVFSVIAPEAAAAILYRDASRGVELAGRLGITVDALEALGLVDVVVPETGFRVANAQVSMQNLSSVVDAELARLADMRPGRRLAARRKRWRQAGRGR